MTWKTMKVDEQDRNFARGINDPIDYAQGILADGMEGWAEDPSVISAIVAIAMNYRDDLTEAVAMLREHQWTLLPDTESYSYVCVCCREEQRDGCADDCEHAALLAKHPEVP